MVKRFLTFALSVGFFIWLPNAFADGNGILSLDAPSHIRQTQNNHKDLLTLRVDNIQVRAEWRVDNAAAAFDIADGVLQLTAAETSGLGTQVVTIYVEDKFDLLNDSYANLTASAVITVEFKSGEFGLSDAPLLMAVAGEAANLYTLVATGGSEDKTYILVAGDERYFSVNASSGVLSLQASVQAGVYTLTVEVADDNSGTVVALATVEVSAALMLADAPLIYVALESTMSLHTFIASGGIGIKTYALTGEDKGYFSVNASSGVLSLLATAQAGVGVHTLTVQAIDVDDRKVNALATVRVSAALMLAEVSSFTVIASMAMSLRTFIVSGGIGTPTYEIVSGDDDGYFDLGATSGVLSLVANAKPDTYVLTVQAMDARDNIAEVVVTVGVSAVLSLADARRLVGAQGVTVSLHTFVAQGGIGSRTYTLLAGEVEDYFSLDAESGVLSLLAATLGIYTLSVQVRDGRDNVVQALATVEVRELFLASAADTLYAIEGRAVRLHTFAAQGSTEDTYTYALVADKEEYFTLGMTSGVLSVKATAPIGIYTLTVQVEDGDDNQANATAVVEVIASLSLVAVPPLTVIVGRVAHTLTASGGIGTHTYAILSGNKDGFALDAASGALSLSVNAGLGRHTLTLQVADARANTVQAVATAEVSAVLALSDAPPFTVIASVAMSLHTFIASGGIGIPTYAILMGNEDGHFDLGAASGVLSLSVNAEPNKYVLRIQVTDGRGNTDEALATVGVSAMLSLADAPRLTAVAGEAVSLHTFSAKGGIGTKTYTLMSGDDVGYFALAESSGVLSLQVSAQEGVYTLTVQVADGASGPVGAVATVEVSAALMLADAPLLSVVLGAAVSLHKFTASGGIGIKTYTLAAGDKGYFSVDASSGVLSLLVGAQEGVHMLIVQAIDERDRKVEALATVRVSAALMLADAPPFTVIAGAAMSLHMFVASGGIGTPTYTIVAGNEKGGFTLNAASGVLSLQADAAVGSHTLMVQVMDARDNTAQAVATVEVSAALVLAAVPSFTVIASVAMSLHTFIASGGIGSRTYTLLAGDKNYFSVGADSGVLSLSVNAEVGRHTLTVQVMDAHNNTAQAVVMVEVSAALALADAPPFTVIISAALSLHTFIASGGIGTPTYTILAGNEKGGFTLNAASGVLSLQADAKPDNYVLRIQAMDARDNTAEALATVGVSAVLILADAPRLGGSEGIPISLHMFEAQGGIGARAYTVLTDDVEDYFSLGAESGVLSLLASATVGVYTLSVQVKDDRGNVANALATVGVDLLFLSDALLYAIVGREVSLHTFDPMGVEGALTYTITAGNNDGYFNLDADHGVLSVGANAPIGIYTLSVLVKDGRSDAEALAVVEVRASLSLVAVPPLTVVVDKVAHTLAASGGIGKHTYAIVSGDEDGGFVLDAASGALSLRADAALGRHTLTLQVADARKNTVQAVATVEVSAALALSDAPPFTVIASVAMSLHMFIASGGIGVPTYTIVSGNEKDHFDLGAASGVLSLAADAEPDTYVLRIQATDARGNTDEAVATVGVSAVLSLVDAPRLTAVAGEAMSLHTFSAKGGIGNNTYTLVGGDDADYFDLDKNSGVLSLLASAQEGVYTLTVQVADADGGSGPVGAVATVEVSAALMLADAPLLSGALGAAVSLHKFTASGGIGIKTYTLAAGDKGYFSVNADNGVLSLLATAQAGVHMVTVQAIDERDRKVEAVATVRVSAALMLADVPPFTVIASVAMSLHTFIASGGIGVKTYTLVAGDDGEYFSVDAASGVLSLSINAPVKDYMLTVQVMDEHGNTDQVMATVGVSAVLSLAEVSPLTIIVGDVSHAFVASGGIGVKTYTITGGDGEGYFALDVISGILSLSADAPAKMYTLTVRAKDERNNIAELVAMVEVSAVLALADAPSFTVIASAAMNLHTFIASGGIGVKTYTLLAGDDKGYFAVDAASGVLALSVNAPVKDYMLTVQVMDEQGNTAQAVAMVEVSAFLSLADSPLLEVIVGDALNLHTFVAGGGIGSSTYTLLAGNDGYFSVGADSGVLSLSAGAGVGRHTLTVQVMDSRDNTAQAVATVGVSAVLALAVPPLTVIASAVMSLHTFASGGIGSRTYTLLAGDDGYFSVGADSGVLSVNAEVGRYTLTVRVMDARGSTAQAVVMVEVSTALVLADAPSFTVIISAAVSLHTFVASGGIGTPTYAVVAGNEAGHFTLNATSGLLSLQADAEPDTYVLRIQAMDAHHNTAEVLATVGVSAVLSLADAPRLGGAQGIAVSLHTFAAQGGIGSRTYTLLAGEVEGYFSLDAASGVLSLLTVAPVATYTLSVQVKDERGNVADALATVGVVPLYLADAPPLYAVVGREVSLHTFAAKGTIGTLSYTITEGDVNSYFDLDADHGVLSVGADAPIGIYTLLVSVSDNSNSGKALAVVEVRASLSLVAVPPLTVIVGGVAHTLVASGGIGTPTYAILVGNTDGHFALGAASGVLSLRADAALGRHTLTLQVADAHTNTVQAVVTVGVSAVLVLADRPLLEVIAGDALSLHTFAADGGIGSRTYILLAGDEGYFSVGAGSGVLSLSADAAVGRHTLTVQVMDERGNTAEAVAMVGVSAVLALAEVPLLEAIAGNALNLHTFAADGGIGSRTYTLLAGDDGYFSVGAGSGVLFLSADAAVGRHTLTVQVMDGRDNTAQAVATVGVSAVLALAAPSFTVIASAAMNLHTFIASGGIGIKTYTLMAGDDEGYFSVDAASGVLALSVNAPVKEYMLTVQVMDERGNTAQAVAMVRVSAVLLLADSPLLEVIAGDALNLHTFVAGGGIGSSTYTLLAGDEGYFSVGAGSGVLSLSADAAVGRHTLTVQVMDERDNTAQAVATVGVSAVLALAAPPFTVIASVAMSLHTFIASGGIGIRTYSLLASDDDGYFSVDAASGVFSLSVNTPAKDYRLTVQVMDERGSIAQAVATVGVSVALVLAEAPPFTVIATVAVSLHTFVASGGIGTPTYAVVSGNEAGHFTLNATSGLLSLQADAEPDTYVLRIQAMDAHHNTAETMATVGVSAVLSLADAPRLGGAQGIAFSLYTFAAQGGIGSRTYTLLTDNVEDYFSLDAESGVLSLLTVAPVATYTLSVQVKDERGNVADALATVGVVLLFLADAPPLYAVVGREVSLHTFAAKGVIGTLTYTIAEGDVNSYFNLDADHGVLSVAADAPIGIYTLSVSVSDERSSAQALVVVEVRASLSLAAVPPLTVIVGGVAHTLVASGGIGTPIYVILEGNTDGHFALDAASGVLSLRADAALGRHTLTLVVADARTNIAQAVVTVGVSAVLVLAEVPLLEGIAGDALSLHTFAADGGIGSRIYTLLAGDDGYFSVGAGSGVLSLSAAAAVGRHTLTVQVMDGRDNTAQAVVTVGVSAFLSLADSPLLEVIVGDALNLHTFVAGGGIGSRTYTLLAGNDGYFSVGAGSGVLSLLADAAVGRHTLTVQVMDERGNTDQAVAMVGVSAVLALAAPPFTVIASVAMSLHTFIASGGIGIRTYSLRASDDDGYFSVDAASGVFSLSVNTPAKDYMLTVQVMDERGSTVQAVATVGVSAALVLAEAPPFTVIASVAMSLHTFISSGGIGLRTYTLAAGDDDGEYFSVNAASGVFSLSVNAPAKDYRLTVQVMDEHGNIVQVVAMVGVSAVLSLTDAPLLPGTEGEAESLYTFEAIGGLGAKTYTVVAGAEYFSVDTASGVLSVDASVTVGIYTLSVQVADAEGNVAPALATVQVVLLLLRDVMLYAIVGREVSLHTFEADGGGGEKFYVITGGNVPQYFTLDAGSGVLSVRANAPVGVYTLSMEARDTAGNVSEALAVVAVESSLFLADAPPLGAIAGITMSVHTFAAGGGIGAKTYTLAAKGQEYFAIDAASGVLSAVNASLGVYTLSVTVSDSRGNQVEARGTVEVVEALSLVDSLSLDALARLSVAVTLHTFTAGGGYGAKRYEMIADESGYFAFDVDSGELSLPQNSAMRAGAYALSVEVSDSLVPPQRATAAVMVRIVKNGIFVLGGNESQTANNNLQNDVWWSVDGGSWRENTSSAGWTARENHQVVAYRGRMYLMGGWEPGSRNDVWSSLDGKNWSLVTGSADWSARGLHQALVHNGRMYVLGGGQDGVGPRNDVWSSADGVTWREDKANNSAGWSARWYHQALVHNGRMYVLGGYDKSDVWSSSDGSSWRFEGDAAWGPRHLYQAVSHAGRLYVLGGIQGANFTNRTNDVWSSLDGRSWEKANNNAFWTKRDRYQALSRDGLLYVLGGNAGNLRKDVWSSSDGKNWTEETSAAGWEAREYHQAVVFPPPLILWGAGETITLTLQVSAEEVYTVTAQYGFGAYTYSLTPENIGFNIDRNGVLSTDDSIQAGAYVITVQVEDEEGSLAQTRIEIEVLPVVSDAPSLFAIVGKAENLHTFVARDQARTYTYTMVSGNGAGYFTLGAASGLLSVSGEATVGLYTLSVEISNSENYRATARATVEIRRLLSLAEALSLTATVGQGGFHTFAAQDGIGAYTYTLLSGNDMGYFVLDESSGSLSLKAEAEARLYTLTVQVSDSRGGQAQAQAVVRGLVFLSWSGLPPLTAIARLSVEVTLHVAVVHGAVGTITYALAAGNNTGYFAFDADSGVLSLPVNGMRLTGDYTLSLAVSDGAAPPNQATAAVMVRLVKNGFFVLGGNDGGLRNDVWWSADGEAWKRETANAGWTGRTDHQAAVYQGRLYVLGGIDDSPKKDVWSSADGKNWVFEGDAAWPARSQHQVVAYQGRLYVLGGLSTNGVVNDVWSWAKGEESWKEETGSAAWTVRRGHQAVVHNGRMYVVGGNDSGTLFDLQSFLHDVWSSADGANWSLVSDDEYRPRVWHEAVSHQGRMYILGGRIYTSASNNVASSLDGKSWRDEKLENNDFWSRRGRFGALSRDGLLYVLGGNGSGLGGGSPEYNREKDVWSSADGRSWTKVTDAAWSARQVKAVVFPSPLILSGTSEKINLILGVSAEEVYTVTAQYGFGAYTYSLTPENIGFNIDSNGVLSTDDSIQAGVYVIAVQVEDEEGSLAQTRIKIEALPLVSDAPALFAIAGKAESLHTFDAIDQAATYTYTIVSGDGEGYFTVGAASGLLSVSGEATVGLYTLSVEISDSENFRATARATVEVRSSLSLAEALSLTTTVGQGGFHTFAAQGGIGAYTYTLLSGNDMGYFVLGESSGKLLLKTEADAGLYTLTVQVSDSRGNQAQALAVVRGLVFLSWSGLPPLPAIARLSVEVTLHAAVVHGAVGAITYAIAAGNDTGYFAFDADSGVLSLPVNEAMLAGDYTLLLAMSDGAVPPHQATAAVVVRLVKNAIFVMGGNDPIFKSDMWWSVDGKAWKGAGAGWPARRSFQAVAYQGRLYVLGGRTSQSYSDHNDVWSTDGVTWRQDKANNNDGWSARRGHQAVVHNDRMYVLGGGAGSTHGNDVRSDVWSSADGVTWSLVTGSADWPARKWHQAVAHNGRIYVLGGYDGSGRKNDVWSSADGSSWRFEGNADWDVREYHRAVSHQGRLYILGGQKIYHNDFNDVWSSLDGKSWRQEKANNNNFWLKRHGFGAVSRDGLLYVLGGARGWGVHLERDVWSSADGRSWTKVGNAGWSARREPQAAVFPSPLALPGIGETITLTLQVKSEIYPFSARYGFGEYTYSLLPKVPGFSIDGSSGVLRADGSAAVGGHTLIVQVEDEEDSRAQTAVKIEVISVSIAALELADAPSFTVIAGVAMSLHTFIASGGLGVKTYALVAGEEAGIFMLDAKSGVLSVVMNAPAGVYTLSVQVSDSTIGTVQVGGIVEVVAPLSLLPVPPLTSWLRLSAAVALHMLTASGGYEEKTYTIIAGNEAGYFAVGESSGGLSLLVNGAMLAGNYTLSVAVSDGLSPPQRATAAVTVRLAKNGIFVLGGAGASRMNDVWSSVDGAIWMQEKADNNEFWPAREEYQVVVHNGRMYVLGGKSDGGRTSDVWLSADGKTWMEETAAADWPAREEHQALVHNGRMYVLGGQSANGRESDVWSSADGKTWTEETAAAAWSGRYGHQALVHNGRMYVLGGFGKSSSFNTRLNDVWSSVNGKNWTLEKEHNNSVGWGGRTGHQVVSHNGRLYLLGGLSFGGKNDVWSSVDGKSWRLEKENDNNQWPRRYRHQVVSRYGEMYVLGGNGSFLNDVWSSVDGKSWQPKKAHNNEGWSDREYHQAVVFPPTLLLSGKGEMNYVALSVSSEIHTFQAQYGFGQYTYSLTPNVPGFGIDESSGLLSADGSASIGNYTLTVWVQDEENSQAQTAVKVDVALSIAALVLADAPLFMVITGVATNLHTFVASGGIGAKTYNLVDEQGYFSLGESSGILSVQAVSEVGVYTLSVEVSDGGGSQATARATVEVAPFLLADVMLYAIVGREVSLHIFETEGGSEAAKTYAIVDGNDDDYFTLDASGVLSVQGNAPVGIYTLFVAADGEGGYRAEGLAVVAVEASLFLADMPLLTAVAGVTMSLHTFAASGGIGAKTYTLAAEGQGYFILNAASGLLSAANAAVGFYTLSVTVSDSRGNSAQARGTVEVVAPLFLADAPPLEALARLSVTVTLHTFVASGGIGSNRYAVIADETDYFAIDADSGELSLPSNSAMLAGAYTLRVEVSDSLSPQRATAAATVQIARNGIFVLGGNESQSATNDLQNDVWSSMDGESWRENTSNAGWTARESHQVVAHRGRMYLMGGFEPGVRNDVWSSADGVTWREDKANNSAGWTARGYHQALVHNGRMYVLGGNDTQNRNDVWSSADGVNWKEETGAAAWSARQGLQAVSHNGRLYVLGGYGGSLKNDVWSSADGASWRFEGNAEWTSRWLYKAVSHNGRLYILGGNDGDRRNDVWSSLDGRSWDEEQANNNAFWTKRGRHQALSRDGLLYVLGGNDGSLRRDVWSSADGKNWTEETSAAGWLAREYHQALVLPPNLALSGTSETITLTLQAAIYTLSAQYGVGQYTYSLTPEIEGINIDGAGVLSADNQAQVGAYEITVRVEDEEGGHAETIIKVDLRFLALADASPLFAIAGLSGAVILHTFAVIYGVAPYTYSLTDDSGYFILSEESGVLLMLNNVPVGTYTLSVAVEGADGSRAQEVVLVTVGAALYLAPTLVLAEAGVTMSLDTFAASGGFGAKTYTLSAGNELGYFSINATSGVLSVVNAAVGYYFLSVRVSDSKDFSGGTQIIVHVVDLPPLSLADAPPLEALARLSVAVSLHSFIASGGYSEKRYAIIAGNQAGYFAVGETSGVLSLPSDSTMMAGHYTLSVEVSDSFVPPQRATAIATVLLEKNRVFVMGGRRVFFSDGSSDVWSSADVEDWRQVTASADWTNRELYQVVSHNGKIYVMGGEIGTQSYLNDVWSSVDGKNWSFEGNAGWSKRRGFQAVSHNGKIYVLGGYGIVGIASREYLNDVWSSVDGKNWSSEGNADWLTRERFQAVSHNGTIYVLGGEDDAGDRKDVWSSVDGASWEKEPAVGWAVRNSHQAVSHNGTIYVLGGVSGGNNGSRKHDVWSSVDGKTWEQKTATAAWSARFGHQVLSRDGRMYVLGGNHSQSLRYNNEVWSSADGVSWKQESTAAWEARHNHQAVIFP